MGAPFNVNSFIEAYNEHKEEIWRSKDFLNRGLSYRLHLNNRDPWGLTVILASCCITKTIIDNMICSSIMFTINQVRRVLLSFQRVVVFLVGRVDK